MIRDRSSEARGLRWVNFKDVALRPNAAVTPPSDAEQHVAVRTLYSDGWPMMSDSRMRPPKPDKVSQVKRPALSSRAP